MPSKTIDTVSLPGSTGIRDRLIVALDVPSAEAARELVNRIGSAVGLYKVGLQLFTAEGPAFVRELVASGRKVFLDLKLHDIPNTVGQAVRSAANLGVSMLTVHGSGGTEMLRAAVEAADRRLAILAVTLLTSFNDNDLHETGVPSDAASQVIHLAKLAKSAGCSGVVSSARETSAVRKVLGPDKLIVNPGIRPTGQGADDQERTATPAEAIRAGASHIVVGRPITKAQDAAKAASMIVQEMEQALLG
jgi:orotidine-5'-phosphate decarboxylase